MLNKLLTVKTSCHHGDSQFENQLEPAKLLTNYDMIEIDFVYHQGQFISSHDYDESIQKGSLLKDWIDFIIKEDKILWIDLKDDPVSIFLPQFSKLDIVALIYQLDQYKLIYDQLEEHVLISCQYHTIYEQLMNLDSSYTIIRDLPKDKFYVMDILIPDFLTSQAKLLMTPEITLDIGHSKIVAIDQQFFTDETLMDFINHCFDVIIVYTYKQTKYIQSEKHIIYQYDFN